MTLRAMQKRYYGCLTMVLGDNMYHEEKIIYGTQQWRNHLERMRIPYTAQQWRNQLERMRIAYTAQQLTYTAQQLTDKLMALKMNTYDYGRTITPPNEVSCSQETNIDMEFYNDFCDKKAEEV